jgi:hypothetical protein
VTKASDKNLPIGEQPLVRSVIDTSAVVSSYLDLHRVFDDRFAGLYKAAEFNSAAFAISQLGAAIAAADSLNSLLNSLQAVSATTLLIQKESALLEDLSRNLRSIDSANSHTAEILKARFYSFIQPPETLSAASVLGTYLYELSGILEPAESSTSFDEKALLFDAEKEFLDIAVGVTDDSADNEVLDFADRFREFILKYRILGVRTFERFCLSEGANLAVLAEGLREFGRMIEPTTQDARMQLLRKCLTHPAPRIRDAAGLGLSLLGDRRAIPFLERAVKAEKRPLCKMTLEKALGELRV